MGIDHSSIVPSGVCPLLFVSHSFFLPIYTHMIPYQITMLNVYYCQAAGTAIGEIPPYWMTKAARLAALETGESHSGDEEMIPEELEHTSNFSIVNRGKAFMIDILRNHGFKGVLMMAAWPNFAFDVCGICCGHFQMEFWTFFGATLIGKAVIRNTYQTLFLVALFKWVSCAL